MEGRNDDSQDNIENSAIISKKGRHLRDIPNLKNIHLGRIVHIDLSNNLISRIDIARTGDDESPFSAFPELISLNLSNNRISRIHANVFSKNRELEHLDLGNNRLQKVDYLRCLYKLENLRSLNISKNSIYEISLRALKKNLSRSKSSLETLYFIQESVSYSEVFKSESKEKRFFEYFPSLKNIDFKSSHINYSSNPRSSLFRKKDLSQGKGFDFSGSLNPRTVSTSRFTDRLEQRRVIYKKEKRNKSQLRDGMVYSEMYSSIVGVGDSLISISPLLLNQVDVSNDGSPLRNISGEISLQEDSPLNFTSMSRDANDIEGIHCTSPPRPISLNGNNLLLNDDSARLITSPSLKLKTKNTFIRIEDKENVDPQTERSTSPFARAFSRAQKLFSTPFDVYHLGVIDPSATMKLSESIRLMPGWSAAMGSKKDSPFAN